MDKYGLSRLYRWLSKDAESLGLYQKAEEYQKICVLLNRAAAVETYGHLPIDLNVILNWKPHFENVLVAWPSYWRDKECGETVIQAFERWLFDYWHWKLGCSPSFVEFFNRIVENIKTILLWTLSPWFHNRI